MERLLEIADLAARWVHVIAGIMWIGNSMLWNWLDRNLEPSSKPGPGMQGEIWLLHSGAFYFMEKTLLHGRALPKPLHWFKWQAYTTWLSGAALLVVVYYAGGRALLVDPSIRDLSATQAVAASVGGLVLAWLAYEAIWRLMAPRAFAAAGALSIVALVAAVYGWTHLLSGRAAFLHVGAMLGTLMAGNVLTTIMPSQRVLVASAAAGTGADPEPGKRAKTRSIHNNYLTFPVLALMVSAHFPSLYGHPRSWLLLLVLIATGAGVRHVMNVRFHFRAWVPTLAGVIAAGAVLLWALGRPASAPRAAAVTTTAGVPAFDDVRSVIDRRCTACHAQEPSITKFGPSPGGANFESRERIEALAPRILVRAVETRTMPPANMTLITDAERELLGRWARGR